MILDEPILTKATKEYTEFEVAGKRVQIPYHIARDQQAREQKWKLWKFSSKGTPEQIHQELEKTASKVGFDLKEATALEINKFMTDYKIGIDCSGFVYHVLDPLVKAKTGRGIGSWVSRFKGFVGAIEKFILSYERVRRIGTKDLARDLNSVPVMKIENIIPGDLIWHAAKHLDENKRRRRHVIVVTSLEVDDTSRELRRINYAHSARETFPSGPHFGTLDVINPHDWLDKQKWEETMTNGANYGEDFFGPSYRSGVRRLRCLAGVCER